MCKKYLVEESSSAHLNTTNVQIFINNVYFVCIVWCDGDTHLNLEIYKLEPHFCQKPSSHRISASHDSKRYIIILLKALSHAAQNAPSGNRLFSNVVDNILCITSCGSRFIHSQLLCVWLAQRSTWVEGSQHPPPVGDSPATAPPYALRCFP